MKSLSVQSLDEFSRLPEEDQDVYIRVTHAISKMKSDRVSLSRAAREYGVTRQQILQIGKKALRRLKNGRYAARAVDYLLRVLVIPTQAGIREIAINDSRQATLLAEYWNAVQRYLETGDSSPLVQFQGKYITDANGERLPLLTDVRELDRLGSAGVLSFESLYARAS
jgi:hypothetical protein